MPRVKRSSPPDYVSDSTPGAGEAIEMMPGVRWLRMPLPFLLGHINLWLLEDEGGWAIVDTGLGNAKTHELWTRVLEQELRNAPVTRVIVTHLHPDHAGCAGWLCQRSGAALHMSREEYLLCRLLLVDSGRPAPPEVLRFYAETGLPGQLVERYEKTFGSFGKVVAPLPLSYQRLTEGMELTIGGRMWRVLVGRGHSVEHACLYCSELNVLISGDQILPTISPNVSVYPAEPLANPLADWLDSLRALRRELPADVLVLPAHGKPFRSAHRRLDELVEEHLEGLDALRSRCRQPVRAVDTFEVLFASDINGNNVMMAAGEAVAHLNYLLLAGEIRSWRDAAGCRWYQAAP